jgi:hypothetical protein
MEDTTQIAKQLVHDVVMSKSVEERLLMCAQLYEDAKEFARIGMPQDLSDKEAQEFIFERIHGAKPEELI